MHGHAAPARQAVAGAHALAAGGRGAWSGSGGSARA
eukprot:CAMPEP_0197394638 /NCGR_PEP_ID=MMETSP1165-20131217/5656_1 /TAXON_ID=284809 /ORGANISM="Chrysocystis fragilis, Strain CCMP3189" /LENGTH=35 /DNA_ID= /DNA_START= /DNA_END= /DNA_ORIENTATION=